MKTISQHIAHIQGKPHHIRRHIAFSLATGATAFIAFVWLATSLSTGVFALKETSFAQSVQTPSPSLNTASGLAGVGAAKGKESDVPAHIEIVDTKDTSVKEKAEPTVIPF